MTRTAFHIAQKLRYHIENELIETTLEHSGLLIAAEVRDQLKGL